MGSEFQADGPVYEKAILPYVDSRGRGTSSCPFAAERRRLRPSITEIVRHRFIMYFGAIPCMHLQTWNRNRKQKIEITENNNKQNKNNKKIIIIIKTIKKMTNGKNEQKYNSIPCSLFWANKEQKRFDQTRNTK